MEFIVDFPGGLKVDARFDDFTVSSDQPANNGGDNSAPSPFLIFLASIGNCAGFYVLSFCKKHDLPVEGVRVIERTSTNPTTHMVESIDIEIQVPPSFPAKYHDALVRAADLCKVKQHLEKPPSFKTYTKVVN
ncbi:MAG: OsmC family protein [Anaerolineae bacterium]|nr:OsmC family protein [Anaerolineae bacterium]